MTFVKSFLIGVGLAAAGLGVLPYLGPPTERATESSPMREALNGATLRRIFPSLAQSAAAMPLCAPLTAGSNRCSDDSARRPDSEELNAYIGSGRSFIEQLDLEPRIEHVLVVLLSPLDCPMCLQEAPIWQELHESLSAETAGAFTVVAIFDQSTPDEVAQVATALDLTFPIYLDDASSIRTATRITETPLKLLMDRKGEILLRNGANRARQQQDALRGLVRRAVTNTAD